MNISAFFRLFQPKDKVFYSLFEQVADNLAAMSKDLVDGLKSEEAITEGFYKKMEDYEHANDKLTHNIYIELGKNFITPFDREDIHQLTSSLDDIADFIYASTKYILLYKSPVMPCYSSFASIINDSVLELKKAIYAMRDLKKPKEVFAHCVEINRMENMADDLFSKEISALFESNKEVLDIIKIKSILEYLEDVTDKCEKSANIIESILVKYS
ncbi:DUF47 domain-containing protein [Apibacter muscae]|uniref:DUF47 domain-containing protein n=1 Tax=Apibacter muscae TaxID=2509004 RepID=A0A563DG13_9FLAO|nr:DUF47 family protein [Apibacter muscae]TWP23675.1 DUF47 domain-containing protein [Apibacter muscae]TWP28961.1 DUF47 domain-containing protein [Apibacter muscae]TWP30462.1 DUF47 domain-containing protein [Apibacter muscae]